MTSDDGTCLIVIPWDLHHVGGVNQVVSNLFRELNERGTLPANLLVNTYGHDSVVSEPGPDGRGRTYRLTVRNPLTKNGTWRTFLSALRHLPGTLQRLRRVFAEQNVAVVNVHYPSLATLAFIIAGGLHRPRIRLLLSFHGADFNQAEAARGLSRALWSFVLARSDRIVTCSSALARRIADRYPGARDKTAVAHNGVDQDKLRRLADAGRMPAELEGRRFIFNAATFEPKKGQDTLLRAFAGIAPRYPDLMLAMMGRESSSLGELRTLAKHLDIEDRVFIRTDVRHEDVMATMQNAGIFALPSRIEPFGIVSLEAATFHVPVVATSVGGVPEIIESGESGLLVEPDDAEALERALTRLLEEPEFAARLAARLHDEVARRFTWHHAATIYENLMGGTRADS